MPDAVRTMSPRLLIVDYDKGAGTSLKQVFAANGYEAVWAKTAEAGLEITAEWEPDLVIAEIILYGLTGLEFCKRTKIRYSDCHVILIAAMVGNALVEEARAQGFDFYNKPVNPAVLINRASQLLSASSWA
jgi:DNA-binding response OmpR family regulator